MMTLKQLYLVRRMRWEAVYLLLGIQLLSGCAMPYPGECFNFNPRAHNLCGFAVPGVQPPINSPYCAGPNEDLLTFCP